MTNAALEKFKEGPVGPTLVLLAICAVITFALAAVYQVTDPVIRRVEKELADEVRTQVLSGAGQEGFDAIEGMELPDGVQEAYRASNGAGYVFKSAAKGFGGEVVFMVGIDSGGEVVGVNLFAHSETPGLGTQVGKEQYLKRYYGDVSPDSVEAIAGATRTTNALKESLKQAKAAYEIVREVA